ncbi:hypothetical protein HDU92_002004 [Lobulomyces angularis]|nr:hypothetical protein HDU92_002004 [Lobulomyces angularis]
MGEDHYSQNHTEELHEYKVFIDPNKRDLLYCLGNNGENLRYTQMQRRSEIQTKVNEKLRHEIEVKHKLRGSKSLQRSASLPSHKTFRRICSLSQELFP